MMTTSNDGIFTTETVGLQKFTMHIDELGVNTKNNSTAKYRFGMLLSLDFEDFGGYMSGKVKCNLYFEIWRLEMAVSAFATFDIVFMVSREEFSSGTIGITEYIQSIKKVWDRFNPPIKLIYDYSFEENTYDGKSEFTAEAYLINDQEDEYALLNIEVYPFPTVMRYVSFSRYSYLDWLADLGGFFTFVTGFFFVVTTRVTKLANRKESFHFAQGILPAFSLSHRNAEEIAGLRYMLMAALGITEEEYFSSNIPNSLVSFRM